MDSYVNGCLFGLPNLPAIEGLLARLYTRPGPFVPYLQMTYPVYVSLTSSTRDTHVQQTGNHSF